MRILATIAAIALALAPAAAPAQLVTSRNVARLYSGTGGTYGAEAQALFDRMTTQPNDTRKVVIDTLIKSLQACGTWSRRDAIYVFAAHSRQAALLNWKSVFYGPTENSAPTFTIDRGFTGDGVGSYLDTGFNPSSGVVQFKLNDSSMGIWLGTDVSSSTQFDIGNNLTRIDGRSTSSLSFRPNTGASQSATLTVSTSVGLSAWSRSNSTTVSPYKNGSNLGDFSATSSGLQSANFLILANNNSTPAAANFSTRRVQAAFWGAGITDTQATCEYSAFAAYMSAVGA